MSNLAVYRQSGLETDFVAKDIRRLSGLGMTHAFDYMTDQQIACVQQKPDKNGVTYTAFSVDCRTQLQNAINAAFLDAGSGGLHIPAGQYYISGPLFWDHPSDGMQVFGPNGDAGGNSLGNGKLLLGDGGIGNIVGGTMLRTPANQVAIWIGPGNGHVVEKIMTYGTASSSDRGSPEQRSTNTEWPAMPNTGAGFSVKVFQAGTRTTFVHCDAQQFWHGFCVGLNTNNGSLGDSNRFYNCNVRCCRYAFSFLLSQVYINDIFTSNTEQCMTSVFTPTFPGVHWAGGNPSCTAANWGQHAISAVSQVGGTFTESGVGQAGTITNFRFTCTLGACPDNVLLIQLNHSSELGTTKGGFTSLDRGSYTNFAVKTPNWGIIGLTLESWNPTTHQAQFKLDFQWSATHLGTSGLSSTFPADTDILNEIANSTTVYAATVVQTFVGQVKVWGGHLENNLSVTTLYAINTGTTEPVAEFNGMICQYDISHQRELNGVSYAGRMDALYYVQQAVPFLQVGRHLVMRNCDFASAGETDETFNIDWLNPTTSKYRLTWEDNTNYTRPTFRIGGTDTTNASLSTMTNSGIYNLPPSNAMGVGSFDVQHAAPGGAQSVANMWFRTGSAASSPAYGNMPAYHTTPRLRADMMPNYIPSPADGTAQPVLHSDAIYSVAAPGDQTLYAFARRIGNFGYSYGCDLPVTWSYKGQTNVINITSGIGYMFPGLLLKIDTSAQSGGGTGFFVVIGVCTQKGYVWVQKASWYSRNRLPGTKTSLYTGTSMLQERLQVVKYGRQCEFGTTDPASAGSTQYYNRGFVCWNTTPSGGSVPFWMCTASGAPGTWKAAGALAA